MPQASMYIFILIYVEYIFEICHFCLKGGHTVYCAECSKMEVLEFNKLRFMPKRYNLPQALLQSLCAPKSVYTYKYTNTILIL